MLAVCVFSHTPFSLWGLQLVERTLRVMWGDYHRIHCQDLEGLRTGWADRGERPVLVMTDAPKEELFRLFEVTGANCVAFLEDPQRIVDAAVYQHGVPPLDALRGCTHFFTALAPVCKIASALILNSDEADTPVDSFVRRVVVHLAVDENTDEVERIVRAILAENPPGPPSRAGEKREALAAALHSGGGMRAVPSPRDVAIVASVVDQYRALYYPEGMSSVVWPRELFFTSNFDNGQPEEIYLAGDARMLLRGPYCFLPRGRWRVTVEFEISDHVSGDVFEADVLFLGGGTLARGSFVLPARGIFRYALDFVVDEARAPIETRLHMLKGAISGVLCLRVVSAARLATAIAPEAVEPSSKSAAPAAIAHDNPEKIPHRDIVVTD